MSFEKIDCIPKAVNVFDETNYPICNEMEDELKNMKSLMGASYSYTTLMCSHCLDPCKKIKYSFKVKEDLRQDEKSETLRMGLAKVEEINVD